MLFTDLLTMTFTPVVLKGRPSRFVRGIHRVSHITPWGAATWSPTGSPTGACLYCCVGPAGYYGCWSVHWKRVLIGRHRDNLWNGGSCWDWLHWILNRGYNWRGGRRRLCGGEWWRSGIVWGIVSGIYLKIGNLVTSTNILELLSRNLNIFHMHKNLYTIWWL